MFSLEIEEDEENIFEINRPKLLDLWEKICSPSFQLSVSVQYWLLSI